MVRRSSPSMGMSFSTSGPFWAPVPFAVEAADTCFSLGQQNPGPGGATQPTPWYFQFLPSARGWKEIPQVPLPTPRLTLQCLTSWEEVALGLPARPPAPTLPSSTLAPRRSKASVQPSSCPALALPAPQVLWQPCLIFRGHQSFQMFSVAPGLRVT